ncbi:MAG: tRNA (adenosine(37)-N6)-threonylcarbamoyltransferase complex ATPase subunit type 1 TsaE [Myxococcota bacterium]
MRRVLPDEGATAAAAAELAALLAPGDLVVLSGSLGAGKTAFVRHLARALGVPADVPVTSPTFALVQEYPEATPLLVHADLYRLLPDDPAAPVDLGALDELGLRELRREAVLAVEWGDRFAEALGGATLRLELAFAPPEAGAEAEAIGEDDEARLLMAEGVGARGLELARAVAGTPRT